ncbi:MAG: Gfo/Idh/MocA family oxidoreductase [Propionivibrio sp.]
MKKTRIAVFGCGYWSQFQIGAWQEFADVEIVALYNRTRSRAEERARQFGIAQSFDDAGQLLATVDVDLVDIITDVDTHFRFVELAAQRGKHVICQKPMSTSVRHACEMVRRCRDAGVKYYVHENYRWQPQFRRIKHIIDAGTIGKPFRCRTAFNTAYPLFETQPFLAQLEQFALTDQGSHQFDVLRFFFGEAESIYCATQRVNPAIKGEDVVTTLLKMKSGVTCIQEISFSSPLEQEVFPQTLLLIEGDQGSIRLDPGLVIKTTIKTDTGSKTTSETVALERYAWQSERLTNEPPSIVACNRNLLDDLRGRGEAETTGADNLKTVELVYAAYDSARDNRVIRL